ncbi:hypothetical protein ACFP1Z_27830 [Streptomyces gamaensis]|uniref:Transmembrane protein n=1 Tax=Streptomyces gamaensis TaxID=1763542 RepID=A0ABW0Z819_9ACTN
MSQPVLALGTAALCASGCVWYLPAAVDLRAGGDRPDSLRLTAAGTLTGWGTLALVGILLLTPAPWQALGAVTATGAVAVAWLWGRSWVQRRREQREESVRWEELRGAGARSPGAPRGSG